MDKCREECLEIIVNCFLHHIEAKTLVWDEEALSQLHAKFTGMNPVPTNISESVERNARAALDLPKGAHIPDLRERDALRRAFVNTKVLVGDWPEVDPVVRCAKRDAEIILKAVENFL